jgi:hypothetical protein
MHTGRSRRFFAIACSAANRFSYVVQLQGGVFLIPAEDLERGEVAMVAVVGEMRKCDLALVPFAIVGDEEQVVLFPSRAIG